MGIQIIMNLIIQIQSMITSIAYTMEADRGLIKMTISLIIWNQFLTTSIIHIMQEELDLIQMIMNRTIEHLENLNKDLEIESMHLQLSKFFVVQIFSKFIAFK